MLGPLREGIMTILIVAGPIIIAAAAVGLLIGILQAATQIQDQTIPSALKLIGVMLLVIFLGVWMFSYLTRFTERTIGKAFSMVMINRDSIPYSEDIKSSENEGDTIQRLPEKLMDMPTSNAPFSQFGANVGNGRLSSSQGSFNATLSPPIKAFSNAMQTEEPPTTYHYNQANNEQFSDGNWRNSNYPSRDSRGRDTYQRNYQSSDSYDDFSDSAMDDYKHQLPQSRDIHQYRQRANQGFVPNSSIDLSGSNSYPSSEQIQQTPYKKPVSQNKVVLESNTKKEEPKKEVEVPEPIKIMKPKLPTYTSSAEKSETNKPLPSEGINWW